ncbi:MAG: bacterio-opsin activator domain-containing protein [Halolamina sp.]
MVGQAPTVLCVGTTPAFEAVCDALCTDHDFRTLLAERPAAVEAPADDGFDYAFVDATDRGGGVDVAGASESGTGTAAVTVTVDDAVTAVVERASELPVVALVDDGHDEAAALSAGADRTVRTGEGAATAAAATLRGVDDAATDAGRDSNRDDGGDGDSADGEATDDGGSLPTATDVPLEDALDALSDVFFVFDLKGRILTWNERLQTVFGYAESELAELGPMDLVAPEDRATAAEAIREVVAEGRASRELRLITADGRPIEYALRGTLLTDADGEPVAVAGTGRDVTARNRRLDALKRQKESLERLNHVNEVIREVNQALVKATTRPEIERAVCEELVEADRYELAWIGDFDLAGRRVERRAAAGRVGGCFDRQPAADDDEWSVADAIRDDEARVVRALSTAGDGWRAEAAAKGFEAAVVVPLTYRTTTYGALVVFAADADAFDDTERTVLAELGETIGGAVNAAERRRALTSDTTVELCLDVPPPGPTFVAVAAETGAALSLEGAVHRETGPVEYHAVDGDADAVVAAARERDAAVDVVADYDDRTVISLSPAEPPVTELLAHHGGALSAATADANGGELVAQLPEGADVRTVVEAIRRAHPGTELEAQRTVERTATAELRFRDTLSELLTDRQQEVVETAHYAGFFEWPRANSAEAVAETLSVSPPTFHEHVRRAERKLVQAYLEGTQGPDG